MGNKEPCAFSLANLLGSRDLASALESLSTGLPVSEEKLYEPSEEEACDSSQILDCQKNSISSRYELARQDVGSVEVFLSVDVEEPVSSLVKVEDDDDSQCWLP